MLGSRELMQPKSQHIALTREATLLKLSLFLSILILFIYFSVRTLYPYDSLLFLGGFFFFFF